MPRQRKKSLTEITERKYNDLTDMGTQDDVRSELGTGYNEVGWCAWGDSNAQPLAPEANALSS